MFSVVSVLLSNEEWAWRVTIHNALVSYSVKQQKGHTPLPPHQIPVQAMCQEKTNHKGLVRKNQPGRRTLPPAKTSQEGPVRKEAHLSPCPAPDPALHQHSRAVVEWSGVISKIGQF